MKIAHIKLAIWILNSSLIVGICATGISIVRTPAAAGEKLKTERVPESRDMHLPSAKSNEKPKLSDYEAIWTKGVQPPPPPKAPVKPPSPPAPASPQDLSPPAPSINSLLRDYVIKGILINSKDSSESVVAIAKTGAQSVCDRFHEGDFLDGENVNVRGLQVARIEETKVFFKFNGKEIKEPLYFDPIMSGSNIVNYGAAVPPASSSTQLGKKRSVVRPIPTPSSSRPTKPAKNFSAQSRLVRPMSNRQAGGPQSAVIASPLDLAKGARFQKHFTEGDRSQTDGMVATFVDPSSVLAAKGLKEGDVIKKINFKPVTDLKQMEALFDSTIRSGARMISLEVERGGKHLWLNYDVDPKARTRRPNAPSIKRPPQR